MQPDVSIWVRKPSPVRDFSNVLGYDGVREPRPLLSLTLFSGRLLSTYNPTHNFRGQKQVGKFFCLLPMGI